VLEPVPRPRVPVPAPLPIESSSSSGPGSDSGASRSSDRSGSSGASRSSGSYAYRSYYEYGSASLSDAQHGGSYTDGSDGSSSGTSGTSDGTSDGSDGSGERLARFSQLSDAEIVAEYRGIAHSQFPEFPPDVAATFIARFMTFDAERRGMVHHLALAELLSGLGKPGSATATAAEIDLIIRSVDTDSNGSVDFGEFLLLMRKLRSGFGGGAAAKYAGLYRTIITQQGRWVHLFRSVEPRRTVDLALRTLQQNLIMYTLVSCSLFFFTFFFFFYKNLSMLTDPSH
jgi:hypothetical protein